MKRIDQEIHFLVNMFDLVLVRKDWVIFTVLIKHFRCVQKIMVIPFCHKTSDLVVERRDRVAV